MTRVLLRDVVAVIGGGTPRRSFHEYFGGSIPWVTPKDMKRSVITGSAVTLTESGLQNSPTKIVPFGSVLVVVRSGVLKHSLPVALTGVPVTLNQDMKALVPTSAVHGPYLARYIKALQPTVLGWVRATTADNFPIDKLLDYEIDLPPLDEQRRIAAILDQADQLRTKRRKVLSHLEGLSQSIFLQMFGDPIRNPLGWNVNRLGEICLRVTDGEHKTPQRSESGVPLLSARSIQKGWIDFNATDFVTDAEYNKLRSRIEPQADDVLISCSGTIGRVARVRDVGRFAMVRSVALIRCGPVLSPGFLEQLLSTATMNKLMNLRANSSAQANLFQNQIRELPIIVPSLQTQRTFESRIEAVRASRQPMSEIADRYDKLTKSLQAHAFSGKL